MYGFIETGEPAYGPSLDNVGKDDDYSWRTQKLVTGVPEGKNLIRKTCTWQLLRRDQKCLANNKRARRQTCTRLQNYKLRNFEPWGRAPTGEDLFDQGIFLEQSFGFDKSVIYYGLGYVMPYDPLADLIYLNSMKIGRSKMHSGSWARKHETACKKAVNLKPRPAEEWEKTWEGKKAGEKAVKRARCESPTPTDDDDWGEWKCWSKLRRMK